MQSTPLCSCVISHSPGPTFPACWAPCMGPLPPIFYHREAVFFSKSSLFTLFLFLQSGGWICFLSGFPLALRRGVRKGQSGPWSLVCIPTALSACARLHSGCITTQKALSTMTGTGWTLHNCLHCSQLTPLKNLFLAQLLTLKKAEQNA